MYPSNDENRRIQYNPANDPDSEPVRSEQYYNGQQPYNEPVRNETTYSGQPYSEPTRNDHNYGGNIPVYNNSVYNGQPYGGQPYSEPARNEPYYNKPVYSEPAYIEPAYSEPPQTLQPEAHKSMYSPNTCATPPYLRTQANEHVAPKAPRRSKSRVGRFVRSMCLVLACAVFSATASYVIMDYRFERGDFTLNNQVVLGSQLSDIRQDEGSSEPATVLTAGMPAQDIYDKALTQVVGIVTETPGLFGTPQAQSTPISGSGFIISTDGYILTNYHVIEIAHVNNLPLSVVMHDGTTYEAKVVGFEANNDVAVIKIDATGLNPTLIGDSSEIRVGQTVYAVGNPFGDLVYTMTDGIVSALDRVVSVEGKSINAFQFSAAVNRGNSGGPIYNTDGEVIGIVTAKVVRGNVEGIGFAIPINDAIEIASQLIEHGYISGRPLIGITGQNVSPGHAEDFGWVVGVYVRSVSPNSAAETAGIAVGDIIIGIGEDEVDSMETLRFALRSYNAGDTTKITVWRNGDEISLPITFDEDMFAGQPHLRPVQEPQSPDPFEDLP